MFLHNIFLALMHAMIINNRVVNRDVVHINLGIREPLGNDSVQLNVDNNIITHAINMGYHEDLFSPHNLIMGFCDEISF